MTIRLTVDRAAWWDHVRATARSCADLLPVVKGNGYGFGRATLAAAAAQIAPDVAVGTVREAIETASVAAPEGTIVVLTPTIDDAGVLGRLPDRASLTVGSSQHVDALVRAGWAGRVQVKLRSAMHRYGASPAELADLVARIGAAGSVIGGYVLHPPLREGARTDDDTVAELTAWLPHLDPSLPISISHVRLDTVHALRQRHPRHRFVVRLGTHLWHGDKSFLHLGADVIDLHELPPGSTAGYRQVRVPDGGQVAMIGAGSANGVAPLADGRSPFHHRRQRLTLLEPPHMHTSMVLIPRGQEPPEVGGWVDLQRPLISTFVDETIWR